MAERFFARVVGLENASTFMTDLVSNQGVVASTVTVTPVSRKHLVVTFYNDIPVVATDGTPTVSFEYGTAEPDWTTYVAVTDGDHASGYTLSVDDSAVDMDTVGTFDVVFTATDASGNVSEAHTIEMTIVDTTIPVITAGAVDVTESEAGTWTPTGTALDGYDGDLTSSMTITYAESDDTPIASLALFQAHIDGLAVAGTAKVIYNVDDASSNSATEVTQVVTIISD